MASQEAVVCRNARVRRHFSKDAATSSSNNSRLSSMYQAPTGLLFKGSMQEAIQEAQSKTRWLVSRALDVYCVWLGQQSPSCFPFN